MHDELRRYVACRDAGDLKGALSAASAACHAAPGAAEPHYAYGEAWLALGEVVRSGQAFAAAAERRPEWVDAWVNLGLAHYRAGAIWPAKLALRRALSLAPGHAVARANLAALMRISGESEGAEALLRDTLARDPGNAGARLNLVADLLQEERPGDALALLDAAPGLPADPTALRHWHLQRVLALLQLGRAAEAREGLRAVAALGPVPAELAPLWHWRWLLLAKAEGRPAVAGAAAERMARALSAMGPRAVPEHRIMGHYDLAKFWSSNGDLDAAFANWQAGHTLLRPTQPFSREEHRAFADASIALLDSARLSAGARAANADPAPVFIVGMPRSGTTLCEQILAAHAQVHGAGERGALSRCFATLGGGYGAAAVARVAALDAAALEAAAAAYLAELHALAPEKTRIVDKMPGNYAYVGLASLLFPEARFIHCVRDPRDIGLSIFTFRFHGSHGYAHDLGDLGWTIAEQGRLMAHWKQALPGRVLTVRLSDWVEDFDATLARVLTHLNLPDDPACARFHERESRVRTVSRSQVRQPVNARGLGRWKPFARHLAPLIAELKQAGALDGWDKAELTTAATTPVTAE